MRKVKNRKVIGRLADRSFKASRTRNVIASLAIALTACSDTAPPASAAIPPAELEEPPRPGERQTADAVVEKARQAVSGFLGSLTGGPDTT